MRDKDEEKKHIKLINVHKAPSSIVISICHISMIVYGLPYHQPNYSQRLGMVSCDKNI